MLNCFQNGNGRFVAWINSWIIAQIKSRLDKVLDKLLENIHKISYSLLIGFLSFGKIVI